MDDAVRVFARYLRRLDAGEPVEFEDCCAEHPALAPRLRELHAKWTAMASQIGSPDWRPDELERRLLELAGPGPDSLSVDSLAVHVGRLRKRGWDGERFAERGEFARGAMGRIVRIWDGELRRSMAKKVLLEPRAGRPQSTHDGAVRLGRFLEEAQITAQLDHPGIVPVHDLGVDEDGNAWFTMRLVRGEDLRSVFEKVAEGAEGWTLARALGVLAKLCEALAFAHSKGVVHRDLKPANVMVGRFGEVYVMDWGLARVMDRPDSRDLRLQEAAQAQSVELSTARTDAERSGDSPLRTMDGHVVGTPAYMPPEQARGEVERLGPRSDVYAVGAMLYHLLAGRMPYLEERSPRSPYEVWEQVRTGPPREIRTLARGRPPELIAICEKAMARDPVQRYADMRELADDLSRFLEHRVVRAYRTGPGTEALKWAERNPLVAGAAAALVVVTLAAGALLAAQSGRRKQVERRALDEYMAPLLVRRADELWPIHPDTVPRMDAWLADAQAFAAALPLYEADLARLRATGEPVMVPEAERPSAAAVHEMTELRTRLVDLQEQEGNAQRRLAQDPSGSPRAVEDRRIVTILGEELPRLRREIERLERALPPDTGVGFGTFEARREHDRLEGLVVQLRELARADDGLIAEVLRRRELATGLARRTLEEHASDWSAASEDVRDPSTCPQYERLDLAAQLGLVPLRRDPASGLWEFWHVLSGERPEARPEGGYAMTGASGLVLVLVPGGDLMLGCSEDTLDRTTQYECFDEVPPHDLRLDPYLLSKYELTQGQWLRLGREGCGDHWAGMHAGQDPMIDLSHPVQGLDWLRASRHLSRWGLRLPSEAQWERAALAGLPAAEEWSTSVVELRQRSNLFFDQEQLDSEIPKPSTPWSRDTGDVYILHAPVGFFPPNAWGLHDMLGNVAEWCRDGYLESGYQEKNSDGIYEPLRDDPRSGELFPSSTRYRPVRGGSYTTALEGFRLTDRRGFRQDLPVPDGGVRPAMDLEPESSPKD